MGQMIRASDAEMLIATTKLILEKKKREREAHLEELERCAEDIPYWISTYCWTFDPRPEVFPHEIPFQLYPFQEDFVRELEVHYQGQKDLLTEKSRDMGATWMIIAWHMHHWLFEEGFQSLWGSRKEDYVDNWKMDTLFPKAEYIVKRWPDWMRPQYKRSFMSLVNQNNGAAIVGESANRDFSRSGRYSTSLLDEFAFWEWAQSVRTATADSTRVRLPVSSPNFKNEFYRWRQSGLIDVKRLHWSQHPKKDRAWYEAEKLRRTPEEIAKELDISYEVSVKGQVYPTFGQLKQGLYPFTPGWPLYTSWDFGLDNENALVWWQRNPVTRMYRAVDCYANSGKTIDFYVPFCTGLVESGLPYGYSEEDLKKIESHRGWGPAVHFGDPAGKQRNQVTASSVISELAKPQHNIYVQTAPEKNTFERRYHDTQLFLARIEGINTPACNPLVDAMNEARFPERNENSQATGAVTKPIHDWTSHFRTAVEYFAVNCGWNEVEEVGEVEREKAAWEYQRR